MNYSPLGHLASLKYSNDTTSVNFAPNAFGLPTQAIKGSDVFVKGGTSKVIYYPNNTINSFTYGNGIKHKTVLNNRKIPSCIVDYKNSQPTCGTGTSGSIVNFKYSYDNNVNITAITNPRNGGIYSLTNLTYDGLDRLKTTTGGYGIGSSTISYDGLGNIRRNKNTSSFDASDLTYSYNSNNRLTTVTGTGSTGYNFNRSDSYDTRGNITHNGKRNFNYNLANQMTNSGSNHYIYDGYNRRIKTTDSKGVSYSMYSQSGKLLYRETPQGGINYIHLGTKLIAKEGTGVVSASDSIMNYKPFGDSIEEPKDGVGYTGHKFDTDLGLSYMQARYYDPVIGRFYSNDPIGFTDIHTFNRYTYVANNPYKYVDPSGMCSQSATASADTKCQNTSNLTTDKNGKDFTTKHEGGSKLTVYADTAQHDTVGVGHKVVQKDNLKLGDQITQTKSDTFFNGDIATAESGAKTLLGGLPTSQNEFNAVTDLVFNVGITNLMDQSKNPGLHSAIQKGDYKAMGRQLTYTKDSKGNRQGGLITRSKEREALFNKK